MGTHVSIRMLKMVHDDTHPTAKTDAASRGDAKNERDEAELLLSLAAEAESEGTGGNDGSDDANG